MTFWEIGGFSALNSPIFPALQNEVFKASQRVSSQTSRPRTAPCPWEKNPCDNAVNDPGAGYRKNRCADHGGRPAVASSKFFYFFVAVFFWRRRFTPAAKTKEAGFAPASRRTDHDRSLKDRSALNGSYDECENCEGKKDHEQYLCDRRRNTGETAKSESGSDKRKDKKYKRPSEHGAPPSWSPTSPTLVGVGRSTDGNPPHFR